MFKHAFIVANLALLGLVSAKKDSDFVFRAKFDPEHADNVEDASWNCIVELGDANPEQICEWKVIDKNIDQLTKLCSLGDKLMFDTLLYNYCKQKEIKKDGKSFHPGKRPYLKKPKATVTKTVMPTFTTKVKPAVTTTVVNINIIDGDLAKPTTITVSAFGKPVTTVTVSPPAHQTTEAAASIKTAKTTFKTKVKGTAKPSPATKSAHPTTKSEAPAAERTCAPAPVSDSGEYDNGQWCIGKYEQAYEEHSEKNGWGSQQPSSNEAPTPKKTKGKAGRGRKSNGEQ